MCAAAAIERPLFAVLNDQIRRVDYQPIGLTRGIGFKGTVLSKTRVIRPTLFTSTSQSRDDRDNYTSSCCLKCLLNDRCAYFQYNTFTSKCKLLEDVKTTFVSKSSFSGSLTAPNLGAISSTDSPTNAPTDEPSLTPTTIPTNRPSHFPTLEPHAISSDLPTLTPTLTPSEFPSYLPTSVPSVTPTETPTRVLTSTIMSLNKIGPVSRLLASRPIDMPGWRMDLIMCNCPKYCFHFLLFYYKTQAFLGFFLSVIAIALVSVDFNANWGKLSAIKTGRLKVFRIFLQAKKDDDSEEMIQHTPLDYARVLLCTCALAITPSMTLWMLHISEGCAEGCDSNVWFADFYPQVRVHFLTTIPVWALLIHLLRYKRRQAAHGLLGRLEEAGATKEV